MLLSHFEYNAGLLKWGSVLLLILSEFQGVQVVSVPISNSQFDYSTFIVGGADAIPHEFPWQVSIQGYLNNNHLCGGVIIDHLTVLTTGTCADLITGQLPSVAAGKHNLSATDDLQQVIPVSSIHIHPDFPGTTGYSNDIAVLKLGSALTMTDSVSPVPHLHNSSSVPSELGTISGWGTKAEEDISVQEILHKATVKLVDNMDCQLLVGSSVTVEESMMCIASPNSIDPVPVDSCTGDQGGPFVMTDEVDGSYVLVGLISFGIGCGRPNLPSFCTRVSSYIDFISLYQESS